MTNEIRNFIFASILILLAAAPNVGNAASAKIVFDTSSVGMPKSKVEASLPNGDKLIDLTRYASFGCSDLEAVIDPSLLRIAEFSKTAAEFFCFDDNGDEASLIVRGIPAKGGFHKIISELKRRQGFKTTYSDPNAIILKNGDKTIAGIYSKDGTATIIYGNEKSVYSIISSAKNVSSNFRTLGK